MARKKNAKLTTEEFREIEREVSEDAGAAAMKRWEEQRREVAEKTRRRALANRAMRQIVEAVMTPPDYVSLPADFAAAWASDRASLLKLIDRPLTSEQTRGVAGAMAVLMEHNRRLRLLAQDLVERLEGTSSAIEGVNTAALAAAKKVREACLAGEGYIDVEDD